MPVCGNCTSPCTCILLEDGFAAGHTELGRNFTQVGGSGSSEDPYVIHFLDQQEFRPRTAELLHSDIPMADGFLLPLSQISIPAPVGSVLYQSPVSFLVIANATPFPTYAEKNYYSIGCAVTFAETADTGSKGKQMGLVVSRGNPAANVLVGSQVVASGGGDPMTLSCQTYTPGLFYQVASLNSAIFVFDLYLQQNSGGTVLVNNIRIWMSQI